MDIIGLDKNSKIMYFIYNFFTLFMISLPIFSDLIPNDIKTSKPDSILCISMVLVILISFFIAITKQKAYSKFILIDDKNLFICKGKKSAPIILEQVKRSEIIQIKRKNIFHNPLVILTDNDDEEEENEIILPSYTPSVLSMFLTIPVIALIFLFKGDINVTKMGNNLSYKLDVPFSLHSHPSKILEMLLNISGWIFLLVDIFMGIACISLLFMYLFACIIQF